jgi:hypothetical protein
VNAPASVEACPSGFVTVTFTAPARCAGVVAVIEVAVTAPTTAAVPPNATLAPAWNDEPVSVTTVPPAVGPLAGESDASAGGGAT